MLGEGQNRTRERSAPEGSGYDPAAAAERPFAFAWSFVEPGLALVISVGPFQLGIFYDKSTVNIVTLI